MSLKKHPLLLTSIVCLAIHLLGQLIQCHVKSLRQSFTAYFPVDMEIKEASWVRDPFLEDLSSLPSSLSAYEKERIIEIASDGHLQMEFKKVPLGDFWLRRKGEYPVIARKAALILAPFCTT